MPGWNHTKEDNSKKKNHESRVLDKIVERLSKLENSQEQCGRTDKRPEKRAVGCRTVIRMDIIPEIVQQSGMPAGIRKVTQTTQLRSF